MRLLRYPVILAAGLSFANLAVAQQEPQSSPGVSGFEDFASLRGDLVSMIAGASKRVFLTSDFLTDADIVSSLYIAQYRKVQIQVLLGKDRASNIMSRLGYLQQVNIQTGFRPRDFFPKYPSLVLIDDHLYSYSAPLDYMTKSKKLTKTRLSPDDIASYENTFQRGENTAPAPAASPLPKVGRARKNTLTPTDAPRPYGKPIQTEDSISASPPNPTPAAATEQKPSGKLMGNGSYKYRTVKDQPGNGIPTKLPKTTIYQQKQRERQMEAEPTNTPSQ